MPEEADRKSCLSKSSYSSVGSNIDLHRHSAHWPRVSAKTTLVRHNGFPATIYVRTNRAPRFIPPHLNREKSNIKNSENTTLFLISCYQYILSGIILSVGPPFRQSMTRNCEACRLSWTDAKLTESLVPFVVTIVVALLITSYMVFDPAEWVCRFMQLTKLSWRFRLFVLALSLVGFACAWLAERKVFLWLAGVIASTHQFFRPEHRKKRKQYKLLLEKMHL